MILPGSAWGKPAMKLAPHAENLKERIALMANLVPRPLLDTQIAFTAARAIMVAAEVGLFEALGKGDQTAEAVAAVCGTDPKATKHLLECLVGIGYASWRDGKYELPASMRKWLLRSSPSSVVAKLAFQSIEWNSGRQDRRVRPQRQTARFSFAYERPGMGDLSGRHARRRR